MTGETSMDNGIAAAVSADDAALAALLRAVNAEGFV